MAGVITSVQISNVQELVLEQSQAAVDMIGHRLIHVKHFDLK